MEDPVSSIDPCKPTPPTSATSATLLHPSALILTKSKPDTDTKILGRPFKLKKVIKKALIILKKAKKVLMEILLLLFIFFIPWVMLAIIGAAQSLRSSSLTWAS